MHDCNQMLRQRLIARSLSAPATDGTGPAFTLNGYRPHELRVVAHKGRCTSQVVHVESSPQAVIAERPEQPPRSDIYSQRHQHGVTHVGGLCCTDEDAIELKRPDSYQ